MSNMLVLDKTAQVASGVQRAVFLHPYDDTKLVKVLKYAKDMPARRNFNGRTDRLFPRLRLRQIRKEYREYLRVMLAVDGSDFKAPISHMYGFVITNFGLGCLTERVTNIDGSLGYTVGAKARSDTLTEYDIHLLNDAIGRIYDNNIRASDLNPDNFVIGHRNNGGGLGPRECVLVDGFGDIHAVPVRSLSRWSNRIGLDDSCARLARNIGLKWHKPRRRLYR